MSKALPRLLWLTILFSSCVSSLHNKKQEETINTNAIGINLPVDRQPDSLTNLTRTQDGGFVLAPGFYEAEFKTYCLQPGTPGPTSNDAYLQAPLSGYRKEIVQTILLNSRTRPDIPQRNVQLLLWSVVSGSDFNKLSPDVRYNAAELLTSKQIFELKGGVMGVIKTISYSLPAASSNGYNEVKRLFDAGTSSYDAFEQMAVLREQAKAKRENFKNDQWYKQDQDYYVRYFPVNYQKVRIQVYVPDGLLDSTGKANGEYIVFNPTGSLAVPANSNAQRLGIGGPFLDVVKAIIEINKAIPPPTPKKLPEPKKEDKKIAT